MESYIIPLLLFFSLAPIVFGFILWIYGRRKNSKNLRHNGFIIMMLSFLLIGIFAFTIGASLFYVWLINN